jgi:Patatin-like phospholipase
MNRLLALDGGGIRGTFTLGVLQRIEEVLRERYAKTKPDFVLADYFNFIGGTSTGSIIATLLSWGMSVGEITASYLALGPQIFVLNRSWSILRHLYSSAALERQMRALLSEDDGSPAALGTKKLRTFLMLVMRNGTRGSVWPLTNNPAAKFNLRSRGVSNLDLPLWKLIRASTAAPTIFPSEQIKVHREEGGFEKFDFIDGGVSPYNNPSVALYLQATLPAYRIEMPAGLDNMLLVSIGTGHNRTQYPPGSFSRINMIGGALRTLFALAASCSVEQDKLCRVLGVCLHGDPIDSELGAMSPSDESDISCRHFLYCRYNHTFTPEDQTRLLRETGSRRGFTLNNIRAMPMMLEIGREYARKNVTEDHLPDGPIGCDLRRPSLS